MERKIEKKFNFLSLKENKEFGCPKREFDPDDAEKPEATYTVWTDTSSYADFQISYVQYV